MMRKPLGPTSTTMQNIFKLKQKKIPKSGAQALDLNFKWLWTRIKDINEWQKEIKNNSQI